MVEFRMSDPVDEQPTYARNKPDVYDDLEIDGRPYIRLAYVPSYKSHLYECRCDICVRHRKQDVKETHSSSFLAGLAVGALGVPLIAAAFHPLYYYPPPPPQVVYIKDERK
jgi:hypothetical protein